MGGYRRSKSGARTRHRHQLGIAPSLQYVDTVANMNSVLTVLCLDLQEKSPTRSGGSSLNSQRVNLSSRSQDLPQLQMVLVDCSNFQQYLRLAICTVAPGQVVGLSENPFECMALPTSVQSLVVWKDSDDVPCNAKCIPWRGRFSAH